MAPLPDLLRIESVTRGGTVLLQCEGEVDAASAGALAAAIDAVDPSGKVDVDLAGVSFLDSSGVRVLALASQHRPLRVVAASPAVARVLTLTGLDRLLS